MDQERQTADPQWDLAVNISLQLRLHSTHEIIIEDCTDQRLVDVRWAVLQAGRMLGTRPRIDVRTAPGHPPTTLTVTITSSDPDSVARARARRGLETLLRAVLEEQQPAAACGPRRAIPRQTASLRAAASQ